MLQPNFSKIKEDIGKRFASFKLTSKIKLKFLNMSKLRQKYGSGKNIANEMCVEEFCELSSAKNLL